MARSQATLTGVPKTLNERNLREFCPDGHRMAWPKQMNGLGETGDDGIVVSLNRDKDRKRSDRRLNLGQCTGGDYWAQQSPLWAGGQWKTRSGMERRVIHGRGGYEVHYTLDPHAAEMKAAASLTCTLGHSVQKAERYYLGLGSAREAKEQEAREKGHIIRGDYAYVLSPLVAPDSIGEANAFVTSLLTEGWKLSPDGRLHCPKCVFEFDELAEELDRVANLERQEAEQSDKHYEYRLRYTDEWHMWVPQEANGIVVRLATKRDIDTAQGRMGIYTPVIVSKEDAARLPLKGAELPDGSRLFSFHPSSIRRVEVRS